MRTKMVEMSLVLERRPGLLTRLVRNTVTVILGRVKHSIIISIIRTRVVCSRPDCSAEF